MQGSARLEPEKAQFNGLDQKLYENVKPLVDREDFRRRPILLENKEEQLNQLRKHWKERERNWSPR